MVQKLTDHLPDIRRIMQTRQMSSIHRLLLHPCKHSSISPTPKPFSLSSKLLGFQKTGQYRIRCESQKPRNPNWTTGDYQVSKIDPIHISPSSSTLPMSSIVPEPAKHSKKVCLFFCPETEALAQRIAVQSDAIELRGINWR